MTLGRRDESVAEAQRALDVDPLSLPINLILGAMLADRRPVRRSDRALQTNARAQSELWHGALGISARRTRGKGMNAEALDSYLSRTEARSANQRNGLADSVRPMRRRAGRGYRLLRIATRQGPLGWLALGRLHGSPGYLPRSATRQERSSGSSAPSAFDPGPWSGFPRNPAFHLLDAEPRYQQLMRETEPVAGRRRQENVSTSASEEVE